MPSMSLIRCKNEALKNSISKASFSASKSENRQVTRFILLIISPHRLLCLIKIKIDGKPDGLFSGDIQS